MSRKIRWFPMVVLFCGVACSARAKHPEITDPAEAAQDPDFAIQGEYFGEGVWEGAATARAGAQVIALGGGQFAVSLTRGGLPGDGWNRGDPHIPPDQLRATRHDGETLIHGEDFTGKIVGDTMSVVGRAGKIQLQLKRTLRRSPTEGAPAPAGAIVLFDGASAENFTDGKLLPNGNLLAGCATRQGFGDYTLHLEFRLSYMPTARGQARSNSGVYLHDCYEVQVLDSFGLEGADNECGGFYQLRRPEVNMCLPPLTWQTYDIEFTAPRYASERKTSEARVMVRHNGVVIQPEFALPHATPGRQEEGPAPRPFYLQGHGNRVEYRNIWVVEKK